MEAYDSEKGFKLCSKEIGQFYRTLSSENRTLVEKMAEKRLFFLKLFRLIEGVIERILTSNFYTI